MCADPLALAVEITTLDFANVLSVLVNKAGINPNVPYVIADFRTGSCTCTNALTHVLAQWERYKSPGCHGLTKVLHTLLRYGADATVPALYEVTPYVAWNICSVQQAGKASWHFKCSCTSMCPHHLT